MQKGDPPRLAWPAAEGECAALVRTHDWAATPLGPPEGWPQSLRTCLDLILPSQAQIVLFWGPDFIAFYNDTYAPTIGLKHPRILGRPAREGWAELWDDLGPLLHSVWDTGQTVSAADRPFQIDRQGFMEEVFFDISYSAVRGESGEVAGVMCIVKETTGQVLASRALAESQEQLRRQSEQIELALNAGAVIATWVWDIPNDRISGDERFARTFSLDMESLRHGVPLDQAKQSIHPDDVEHVNALIGEAMARGGPYSAEYRVRQQDGGWLWIEANGRVELAADGTPVRFPGVLIDISRRKSIEAARSAVEATLRESEERFRALAQALPNQVWTAAPDGRLDWINQRVMGYSGRTEAELMGDGWGGIVHPDDLGRVSGIWLASIAQQVAYETEFRIRRFDGVYRWHLVRALPAGSEDATGRKRWIGTNTDIDDQKAAQATLADLNSVLEQRVQERTRELQEAEARLRQSQKMEALGQLTGGIAHDFNNLLQGITGAIEVLRLRLKAGRTEDADRYLSSAVSSAHRAAALVHRLLAFARRQSLDAQGVDINALVLSMEDLLRRTLGENIGLLVDTAPGAWPALCDGNQLESAILNLTINARDAMPRGGLLTLTTGNVVLEAAEAARMEGLPPGEYATVCVADTGSGMPPDVLAKVFDPFFTTKPIGQGTGLGLSMIYGFARQSGGHVTLASEEGKGTSATLYLPRHVQEEDAPPDSLPAPHAPQGDGETVLVVEDDPNVRAVVVEVLRELGYEVLEAVNGATALPHLQHEGRIDLLVSDVGLPGMNGRQLAELARQLRPQLRVLLMTGYTAAAAERGEFLGGGMEMLTKPFAVDDLARKVQAMLGERAA